MGLDFNLLIVTAQEHSHLHSENQYLGTRGIASPQHLPPTEFLDFKPFTHSFTCRKPKSNESYLDYYKSVFMEKYIGFVEFANKCGEKEGVVEVGQEEYVYDRIYTKPMYSSLVIGTPPQGYKCDTTNLQFNLRMTEKDNNITFEFHLYITPAFMIGRPADMMKMKKAKELEAEEAKVIDLPKDS